MLEFELGVELVCRELSRSQQIFINLQQKADQKSREFYQQKVSELKECLNIAVDIVKRYNFVRKNASAEDTTVRENGIQQEFFTYINNFLQPEKWETSPLLRATYQQLKKTYDTVCLWEDEASKAHAVKEARITALAAQRASMIPVFVSLYQADGLNIKKWAALLDSMGGLATSRPVYQQESDLRAVIRAKEQKQNEAYVAVYVYPQAILPAAPGQVTQDKNGYNLLFIKEGALHPENIIHFEHISGDYVLKEGALIKQGNGFFV